MKCPACKSVLVILEFKNIEVDICGQCRGIWFDAEEIDLLLDALDAIAEGQRSLEATLSNLPSRRSEPKRKCPRCDLRLVVVDAPGEGGPVALDRCPKGDGLWFDRGEVAKIAAAKSVGLPHFDRIQEFLGRLTEPMPHRKAQES